MPSSAKYSPPANAFFEKSEKAFLLATCSSKKASKGFARSKSQEHYHAALAAFVAAWESYIEDTSLYYLNKSSNPLDVQYNTIHSSFSDLAKEQIQKFNTPNFENSRNLLIRVIGYDPIGDWIWAKRGMNSIQTKERLNEILKVRHSFAHGFSLPNLDWLNDSKGIPRFTLKTSNDIRSFFDFLVETTEKGISAHFNARFSSSSKTWS